MNTSNYKRGNTFSTTKKVTVYNAGDYPESQKRHIPVVVKRLRFLECMNRLLLIVPTLS